MDEFPQRQHRLQVASIDKHNEDKMLRTKLLTAIAVAVAAFGNLQAQEADLIKDVAAEAVDAIETVAEVSDALAETADSATAVSLDEEGQLLGKAFVAGEETPLEAKVTISNSEGIVVDTVQAQEDGSFAFASIAPGTYNMYASAANYAAAQEFDVVPFSGGSGCSTCDLGLTSFEQPVYETFSNAPVSACSACSAPPVSSCGCGGGGGGGLFSGGGGGGGLLRNPIVRLGAIGGIIAIATGDDDDDDASPDS